MYAALAWGGLGAWLLDPTPWRLALYAALGAVLTLKIRREEQALRRHYPGYTHYAARTGRILPRLFAVQK